jgi:hypothetical protein
MAVNQLSDLLAVLLDWGDSGSSVAFGMSVAITEIPNNVPLSIFTVGHELDACPKDFNFPDNIQQTLPIFFDPGLDWSSEISKFQNHLNSEWVSFCVRQ